MPCVLYKASRQWHDGALGTYIALFYLLAKQEAARVALTQCSLPSHTMTVSPEVESLAEETFEISGATI